MSELMNTQNTGRGFRWCLLTTVSTLALVAAVDMHDAKAAGDDGDRPTVWIEIGGQLEHVGGHGDPFTPGFVAANPNSPVLTPVSPIQAQNPPPFSFAESGKISFQPEASDWVFSAAVRYGRSSNSKLVDHQTTGVHRKYRSGVPNPTHLPYTQENFANTKVQHKESHAVLDFSAGKDVGLGLFGRDASSIFSLGVRFAQFASKTMFDARALPDLSAKYVPSAGAPTRAPFLNYHSYHATGVASRSFHGIGPSLSWNGSTPFVGTPQSGELSFDWGANAAILFGKQKARVRHQETGHYVSALAVFNTPPYTVTYQNAGGHDTDRSVIVPNVGGFAGASWRTENVKVSLGYRADFFFGAMDVGIDARKSATLGFYGPFASVSVGLGG
jgi:hypothetical protein